ncbi:predicted protein [Histoplasma mississippiense (nom. inval.)]|uniref:predicted protein n=1 Tax=Ajellomyces capsulatus (strain NAm1 / WU24) TaxID=2059318 RepID=UPI000157BF88|nr:predicted protein [Histoplasma mississippiense (nom. inval.)]EDN07015.1 predicted protein [Histoplasma mississippiense (nom. inval.)]
MLAISVIYPTLNYLGSASDAEQNGISEQSGFHLATGYQNLKWQPDQYIPAV